MADFKGLRVTRSYTQTIHAGPDAVFPLLCPVREMEWLDGWRCAVIHSRSGLAERDGIYATRQDAESDTIWVVTQRDAGLRTVEFVYFVPGSRVTRLKISVHPEGKDVSRVEIAYVYTGISEEGNRVIECEFTEERFAQKMRHWEASMNHYLETGDKLAGH
jgi:hypothetical protein